MHSYESLIDEQWMHEWMRVHMREHNVQRTFIGNKARICVCDEHANVKFYKLLQFDCIACGAHIYVFAHSYKT